MSLLRTAGLMVVTCVVATAGCSLTQTEESHGSATTSAETLRAADFSDEDAEIRAGLDGAVDAGLTPGVVALVRRGDRTRIFVSGLADREHHTSMTARHRFQIASVTKSMVAAVVLQLVDEGKVSLDDTVGEWLPRLVPNGDHITIEELLSHTSGLFDFASLPGRPAMVQRGDITPSQLVRLAVAQPPTFEPGQGVAYSNTGYVLLGMIIERATGSSIEANLQTRIFAPLHMASTSTQQAQAMDPPLAHGYQHGRDVTQADLSVPWAAGFVVSTAPEVAHFYDALLGGRLLQPDLLTDMTAAHAGAILGWDNYGLGLARIDVAGCTTAYGHDGVGIGFQTQAWTSADNDRQVVIMVNTGDQALGSTFWYVLKETFCAT